MQPLVQKVLQLIRHGYGWTGGSLLNCLYPQCIGFSKKHRSLEELSVLMRWEAFSFAPPCFKNTCYPCAIYRNLFLAFCFVFIFLKQSCYETSYYLFCSRKKTKLDFMFPFNPYHFSCESFLHIYTNSYIRKDVEW